MSHLEEQFALQLRAAKLEPVREYVFHPTRKWRFDFAWPPVRLAVEVEGGIFAGGAHTRGAHFRSDCEKHNAACELGWRTLRYTDREIRNGSALAQVERLLTALSILTLDPQP
jgi:very-short-patch-repair endonuclease